MPDLIKRLFGIMMMSTHTRSPEIVGLLQLDCIYSQGRWALLTYCSLLL